MAHFVSSRAILRVAILGGVVLIGVGVPYAVGGHTARVKQDLTPTTAAPNAEGRARLILHSSKRGKFAIVARHLTRNKQYTVIVAGVKVGALQTGLSGGGRVLFSTQPRARDHMLGFDPRGNQIIVRDEDDGDDMLVGDVPDDDPAAVACCLSDEADDGGIECEKLPPEECAAAGGMPLGVPGGTTGVSCLPDPCATLPPPGKEIVCCTNATHDDESDAECHEVATVADCAALDGMAVEASSCDPNPCAVTPPPNQAACCIADNGRDEGEDAGESECKVISAEACAAAGGKVSSSTSCHPDPCDVDGDDDSEGDHGGGNHDGGGGDEND